MSREVAGPRLVHVVALRALRAPDRYTALVENMEILMKWLAISVVVLALAQVGKAVRLTFLTGAPAPPLEIVKLFPDPAGSEDLAAWVLEPAPVPPFLLRSTPRARATLRHSSTGLLRSVATRNRNPLNIKLGSQTRRYVDIGLATISDIIPKDGGRFLKFDSPATGFRAAVELLSTPLYDDLELDRVLRRWSHNSYGAEVLAGTALDAQRPVPYLGQDDLKILLNAMAAAEGYKSSTIAAEIKKALMP